MKNNHDFQYCPNMQKILLKKKLTFNDKLSEQDHTNKLFEKIIWVVPDFVWIEDF